MVEVVEDGIETYPFGGRMRRQKRRW